MTAYTTVRNNRTNMYLIGYCVTLTSWWGWDHVKKLWNKAAISVPWSRLDLFHDLDLSDKFHAVIVILGEALNALDGYDDSCVSAFGLDNSSKGTFADFLKNLVVLSDINPYIWKAKFPEDLCLAVHIVNWLSCGDVLMSVGLDWLVVERSHVVEGWLVLVITVHNRWKC